MYQLNMSGGTPVKRPSFRGAKPASPARSGARPQSGGFRGNSNSGSRPPHRGGGRKARPITKIDVSRYINKNAVVEKTVPYVPKHAFADFAVDARLKANIVAKGYVTPSPIQDQSIPVILEGRDIVGIANTGTGKTAAFLIPLIHKCLTNPKEQVLVIAPTRELAQQINDELVGFTKGMKMYSAVAVGGLPIGRQIRDLSYFNSFVIGTPGRIKDLLDRKAINLSLFNTLVLDEADRMLDMGFINDIKLMISKMPKVRHTLFFSATLSPEIERLIHEFLTKPVSVSVKTGDTAKSVLQDVVVVKDPSTKIDMLHELLSNEEFDKVLIFGRTKHGVQKLSDVLSKKGHKSSAIHGNKNQGQRQRALDDFKKNRTRILVATDVAARGLDIPNVSHVINYDVPSTHEDYIHRIGRTGRAGKVGKALTFVD